MSFVKLKAFDFQKIAI